MSRPTQSSYMCRLRIPNGILTHWQFAGLADVAEKYAGPYSHVTTRANLQLREIEPKNAVAVVEAIQDLGLCSRGSGADNIRNVTGTPTAGIDPQELLDTRPHAREWHHHILNDRSLYGLPRKFNVAFDGAGKIAVLEDTNDIGFQAVVVKDGFGVEPGLYYRLTLGGITGHKDFARDTGVILKPAEATAISDAIVRVFIENGNRTDRNKARLKYVLDAWGFDKFLAAVEEKLGRKLLRVPPEALEAAPGLRPPRPYRRACAEAGRPELGRRRAAGRQDDARADARHRQTRARIRRRRYPPDRLAESADLRRAGCEGRDRSRKRSQRSGLSTKATSIRAGLVACTGSTGCRFAGAHTKENAEEIAHWCEARVALDSPVNIHLTGCHHSCAQHYIGDIGLIGARVAINDDGDTVDGYHVHVGGGFGPEAAIGREIYRDVKAEAAPKVVERMLKGYLAHRASADETFLTFSKRHEVDALKGLFNAEAVE